MVIRMSASANSSRRIRVIVNRSAGQKPFRSANPPAMAEIEQRLRDVGLVFELVIPESAEETTLAAREAVAMGCDLVVAAGGDGTAAMVATELVGSDTTLGILPLGSVMNIARMLSIPRDISKAIKLLASGNPRRIDVGQANGIYFFEAVSIGINAELIEAFDAFERGEIRSALHAINRIRSYEPVSLSLTIDGRTIDTSAMVVAVHNGPYVGAPLTVDPKAQLDDHRLDVLVFRHFSKWGLVQYFASAAIDRHRHHPRISRLSGKQIRVESSIPMAVRADINNAGTTPVDIRSVPRALSVIAGTAMAHTERHLPVIDSAFG